MQSSLFARPCHLSQSSFLTTATLSTYHALLYCRSPLKHLHLPMQGSVSAKRNSPTPTRFNSGMPIGSAAPPGDDPDMPSSHRHAGQPQHFRYGGSDTAPPLNPDHTVYPPSSPPVQHLLPNTSSVLHGVCSDARNAALQSAFGYGGSGLRLLTQITGSPQQAPIAAENRDWRLAATRGSPQRLVARTQSVRIVKDH